MEKERKKKREKRKERNNTRRRLTIVPLVLTLFPICSDHFVVHASEEKGRPRKRVITIIQSRIFVVLSHRQRATGVLEPGGTLKDSLLIPVTM
ncbi:hypothetical protein ANTQUA_LOCUS1191 [Anthophora quadrimaculata]